MGNNNSTAHDDNSKHATFGPAATAHISLAQAILAPMDALAKSQVHAARSFLNFLLQIGYPHKPPKAKDGTPAKPIETQEAGLEKTQSQSDVCYNLNFRLKNPNADESGKEYLDISIPTLALVPAHPLAIESADYSVELVVTHIEEHRQIQSSEDQMLAEEKFGSMDFNNDEFTGRFTINRLCRRLRADKLVGNDKCETLEDLNNLLNKIDLIKEIRALKTKREEEFIPSPALSKLEKIYSDTKDTHDLKSLNRIALEECYPDQVPKNLENRKHLPRPWYLVSEPVSVRGNMAPNDPNNAKASIKVNVKVAKAPPPAGLTKLLTSMTQVSSMAEMSSKPQKPKTKEVPDSSE